MALETPFTANTILNFHFDYMHPSLTCHTGSSICFSPLDQYFSEKFSSIQRKRALKYHFLDDLPRKEKVYCENCTTDWMDLTNRIKEMFRQPFQEKFKHMSFLSHFLSHP